MGKGLKVGLALGSGLARGLAHIGVLKVFSRVGINIDCVAGTSMGSVIAALYASGIKLRMMERLAQQIARRNWMDFTFPRTGLIAGERLEELLCLLTRRRSIEELSLPLAVVAVDLVSGERVVLRRGSIARAVRASCSIPGIFSPVDSGGRLLVDGGVLERVPVSAVREMGAEFVIAVDVGYYVEEYKINNIFDVLSRAFDVMSREICRSRFCNADVLITPDMKDVAPFHFHLAGDAITRGEEAARQVLPLLDALT